MNPKRRRAPSKKTGPVNDKLPLGYKPHENASASAAGTFIPKIA